MSTHPILRAAPLAIAYSLAFFGTTIIPVWIAESAHRYGLAVGEVGLIASLELTCVALAAGASAAVRTMGYRQLPLVMAVCVSIAANLGSFVAPTLILFALSRAAVGLAHGYILADITRRAARAPNPPRIFAAQLFALVATAIVFFTNAPLISAKFGPGAVFLYYAVVGLVTLGSLLGLERGPDIPPQAAAQPGSKSGLPVTMALAGATLLFCIQTSLWSYLQPAATAAGLGLADLTRLLALGAAINLLAPVAADRLGERGGRLAPFVLGFGSLGLSAVLVAAGLGPKAFAAGVIGLSFSTIFLGPFIMGAFLRLDPTGRVAATGQAFFMVGLATGPAVGALLLNLFGLIGLAVFGVSAALAACLFLSASRPRVALDA